MEIDLTQLIEQAYDGAPSPAPAPRLTTWEYNVLADGSPIGCIITFKAKDWTGAVARAKEILTVLQNAGPYGLPSPAQLPWPDVTVQLYFHSMHFKLDDDHQSIYEH